MLSEERRRKIEQLVEATAYALENTFPEGRLAAFRRSVEGSSVRGLEIDFGGERFSVTFDPRVSGAALEPAPLHEEEELCRARS